MFWDNDVKRCAGGPPRGRTWFKVTVTARGDLPASVLLNDAPLFDMTPQGEGLGRVGVLASNRWQNVVFFKNVLLTAVAESEGGAVYLCVYRFVSICDCLYMSLYVFICICIHIYIYT